MKNSLLHILSGLNVLQHFLELVMQLAIALNTIIIDCMYKWLL